MRVSWQAKLFLILSLVYQSVPTYYLTASEHSKDVYTEYLSKTRKGKTVDRLVEIRETTELLDTKMLGRCSQRSDGTRLIEILPRELLGRHTYKAVLFHELAHCLHEVAHTYKLLLMSPLMYTEEVYWTIYLDVAMLELNEYLSGRPSSTLFMKEMR